MKKNIKDYLHLYFGCEVITSKGVGVLDGISKTHVQVEFEKEVIGFLFTDIKPLLRPLSDMSEEEKDEVDNLIMEVILHASPQNVSKLSKWYTNRKFDVFDLIPEGLALDATKQPK